MPNENTTSDFVNQLIYLLREFDELKTNSDLRPRVQALIPIHKGILDIGPSLIPRQIAASASKRLLHYFQLYPLTVLPREELAIVAGIDEWARRVRELRVEQGWAIISGTTAKHMATEGEFPIKDVEPDLLRPDDYILINPLQDRDAAHRWSTAKRIRNEKLGVRDKILEFLRQNVGVPVSGEELSYVASGRTEWARRVRELRTEYGWPIVTKQSGNIDLPVGMYLLEEDRQSPPHDRKIDDRVRRAVLMRDEYKCRRCGWNHTLYNRSDPRHLELHHIKHHVNYGANTADNLITLCTVCHDEWHSISDVYGEAGFFDWLKS